MTNEEDKWAVERVVALGPETLGPLRPHIVHASNKRNGRRYMIQLSQADSCLLSAVARGSRQLIPQCILQLADTPEAALKQWRDEYACSSIQEAKQRAMPCGYVEA